MLPSIPALSDISNQALYLRYVCLHRRCVAQLGVQCLHKVHKNRSHYLQVQISWLAKDTGNSDFKKDLSQKPPILPPTCTTESVPCKMASDTTRLQDMMSTSSSTAPDMPPASTTDRLLWDRTSDGPIIPPLRNTPGGKDTEQSVPGSHSSRPSCVYQGSVPVLCEKLGNQLLKEIDTTIERTVRQQLDAPLPAVLGG